MYEIIAGAACYFLPVLGSLVFIGSVELWRRLRR